MRKQFKTSKPIIVNDPWSLDAEVGDVYFSQGSVYRLREPRSRGRRSNGELDAVRVKPPKGYTSAEYDSKTGFIWWVR